MNFNKMNLSKKILAEAVVNYLQIFEENNMGIDEIETILIDLISNCTNDRIKLCR